LFGRLRPLYGGRFHPEFSGRDSVFLSLDQAEIKAELNEIIALLKSQVH